jgi:hypothetical protein
MERERDCIDYYIHGLAKYLGSIDTYVASGSYVLLTSKFCLYKNKTATVSLFHLSEQWTTGVSPNCIFPMGNIEQPQEHN